MFALVTTIRGTPGRHKRPDIERARAAVRSSPDFKGILVLRDRQDAESVSITLWETEEAANASRQPGSPLAQIHDAVTAAEGATAPLPSKIYEVVVEA